MAEKSVPPEPGVPYRAMFTLDTLPSHLALEPPPGVLRPICSEASSHVRELYSFTVINENARTYHLRIRTRRIALPSTTLVTMRIN